MSNELARLTVVIIVLLTLLILLTITAEALKNNTIPEEWRKRNQNQKW